MNREDEVFKNFLVEMGEKLDELEGGLAELEEGFSQDVVNKLFRAVHTIKGGGGFFGLTKVSELSHIFEDLLMKVREGDLSYSEEMIGPFYSACDALKGMHESEDLGNSLDITQICSELKAVEGSDKIPESTLTEKSDHEPTEIVWEKDGKDLCQLRKKFAIENDRKFHPLMLLGDLSEVPKSIQIYICESYLHASQFYGNPGIKFSFESQVRIIANSNIRHDALTVKWLHAVANAYGFSFANLFGLTGFLSKTAKMLAKSGRLFFSSFDKIALAGSLAKPVANIYDASIVASNWLRKRPSRLTCFCLSVRRLVNFRSAYKGI